MSTQAEASSTGTPLLGDALASALPAKRRVELSWTAKRVIADVIALVAGTGVVLLAERRAGLGALTTPWTIALAVIALLLYARRGAYSWQMGLDVVEDARLILTQTGLATIVVLAAWSVTMTRTTSASAAVFTWLLMSNGVLLGRLALYAHESHTRRKQETLRRTLIIGAGTVATWLARRLVEHPEFGLRPVGFVDDDPPSVNGISKRVPLLGSIGDLESLVAEYGVAQVIITFSRASHDELLGVIDRCGNLGVSVALVPRLFERSTREVALEHLGGLPLIRVRAIDPRGWYFHVKYAVDPIVAGLMLLVTLPLLAVVTTAVWISVGRPILFRQKRVGRDGKVFEMLKFRTMRGTIEDDEDHRVLPSGVAPGGVEGHQDRRTRVGRILRRMSLDEFPQLINVLRGEMSLVGPRPERPEFVESFNSSVRGYDRRHRVKCGITGWSQIKGLRGQTSIADRAEYDNYYIENFSFWLDVKILVLTCVTLVQGLASRTAPES